LCARVRIFAGNAQTFAIAIAIAIAIVAYLARRDGLACLFFLFPTQGSHGLQPYSFFVTGTEAEKNEPLP
jgi:hypothetical protein